MPRLIVQAVSNEHTGSDSVYRLEILASVSRADDGSPVSELGIANFRVASSVGLVLDPKPHGAYELKWETADVEPAGCYRLSISRGGGESFGEKWYEGEFYQFAVQARTFSDGRPRVVVDQGQGIVRVESLGQ